MAPASCLCSSPRVGGLLVVDATLFELLDGLLVVKTLDQALDEAHRGADALLGGEVLKSFKVVELSDEPSEPALGDVELVLIEDAPGFGQDRSLTPHTVRSAYVRTCVTG